MGAPKVMGARPENQTREAMEAAKVAHPAGAGRRPRRTNPRLPKLTTAPVVHETVTPVLIRGVHTTEFIGTLVVATCATVALGAHWITAEVWLAVIAGKQAVYTLGRSIAKRK